MFGLKSEINSLAFLAPAILLTMAAWACQDVTAI